MTKEAQSWNVTGEDALHVGMGDMSVHVFLDQWLEIVFSQPVKLATYSFATMEEECPKQWTLYGAHANREVFTALHTVSDEVCQDGVFSQKHAIVSDEQHSSYRWHFSRMTPGTVAEWHRNGYRLREVVLECEELPNHGNEL